MAELLPCPFCGSENIKIGDSDKINLLSIQFKEPIVFVECMDCYAVAGLYKKNYKHYENTNAKEQAIKKWNTRTQNKNDFKE